MGSIGRARDAVFDELAGSLSEWFGFDSSEWVAAECGRADGRILVVGSGPGRRVLGFGFFCPTGAGVWVELRTESMSSKFDEIGSAVGVAADSAVSAVASELEERSWGGGFQPAGAVTSIIVPHLGQARICPTSDGLATFNLVAHDLQMMENGDNELSLR